jgi:UDP-GlcNAc:undecaprenyl-phosphate GlcNAc-1-phosphate transferase
MTMLGPTLLLILVSFVLGVPLTLAARSLGHRLNAFDSAGVKGQVKVGARRIPNTGGIAIFWSFVAPIIVGLVAMNSGLSARLVEWLPALGQHLPGLREMTPKAVALLACIGVLHVMGLIDDRRPLPAHPKLVVMCLVAVAASWITDTRLLTALDPHADGPWLSIIITATWFVVVTNAFNFLDNMDGLSAGVGAICAGFFLVTTVVAPQPQWFVGACLALLLGALLAFLVFNFPFRSPCQSVAAGTNDAAQGVLLRQNGASIFQGDGGSLVVGFLLAFLAVRITYLPLDATAHSSHAPSLLNASQWAALLTPLVILAIPLYDFTSVTIIRLSQGKSPFVGDLQHFSHRLVRHGLSRRAAVIVIYGCTCVTAIGGVALASLRPWQAALVFAQTGLVLMVLALYEWAQTPSHADPNTGRRP